MLVYKPSGIEGTQIANFYKKKLNKSKVTLCGKLDIMAQGLLLLLFDDDCKKMNQHLSHDKIYKFQILWGIQTDTDDPLGIIQNTANIDSIDHNFIQNHLTQFIGTFNQNFHIYSAITATNKSGERHKLWKWAKLQRLHEITIPSKLVTVKYIKLLNTSKVSLQYIKSNIYNKLQHIKGDYRQDIIKLQWMNFNSNQNFYITDFEAHVSTGFYIRQLIRDLSTKTKLIGLAFSIDRTSIIL
tara:strand:- start:612 stop:1334 length:723 start_codon:yes stop_codon:yes gene_type:complete